MAALKRLARYLALRQRLVMKYPKQGPVKTAIGWSDSDWAGCLETRKSITGSVFTLTPCDPGMGYNSVSDSHFVRRSRILRSCEDGISTARN